LFLVASHDELDAIKNHLIETQEFRFLESKPGNDGEDVTTKIHRFHIPGRLKS
jgi:hypothetical protein